MLGVFFCSFSLLFHQGQDLTELQGNETKLFTATTGDQNQTA